MILAGVAVLFALSSEAGAISLSEYVREAIQAHPEVKQKIHYYREVQQDAVIARSGWQPIVDLDASTGQYSTKSPITGQERRDYDSSLGSVTVTQNLFNGFETTAQIAQNEARLASARYDLYDTADNVALDAARAYLSALMHKRLVDLARANLASHERILAQLQERNDSGVGRRSELEQTEGRVAQAHASLIAQQTNLQDALTQLHQVLGRYVSVDELEDPAVPVAAGQDIEALISQALEEHPAIRVAQHNVEAAYQEYERSKSRDYPQLDLQLQKLVGKDLNGYDGDTDEHSIVLNMRYNLYNGGADRAEQRKRVSTIHENDEYARQTRRQVIETLRLAWSAETGLTEQLRYLQLHVDKARQTVDSYHQEFFIGQRDLVDLLDAESEHNSAQMRLTEARFDELSARYRIKEAMGSLFPAVGLDVRMAGDELSISKLDPAGVDTLPLDPDRDEDRRLDRADHCDNSRADAKVKETGCAPPTLIPGVPFIEPVNFIFDRADLVPESQRRVAKIIEQLKGFPRADIEVVAYTDALGSDAYNQRLSDARAAAIKQLLVEAGFDPRLIHARGRGESNPIADNGTEAGRARNRRIEFMVIPAVQSLPAYGAAQAGSDTDPVKAASRIKPGVRIVCPVSFIADRAQLFPVSQAYLDAFAERLKQFPRARVVIYAHTDAQGSAAYNEKLSTRRAEKIRQLLAERGLDGSRIHAFGRGESEPIADNATEEGRRSNRRVELLVMPDQGEQIRRTQMRGAPAEEFVETRR